MTRIRPYHNNLIVEDHALGGVSKSGLLIPDIARASTPYRYATVIAIGPGRYAGDGTLVPCSSKVGDVIAYAKNAGQEFVGSSRVDLQACKLEYSIVSPK